MNTNALPTICSSCPVESCSARGSRPAVEVHSIGKNNWLAALLAAEMLVVPREPGSKLGGALRALDELLHGALSQAIETHAFTGAIGQRLLVPINQEGVKLRFVLFVGLEETEGVQRYHLCGFYRAALDEAQEHGVTRVTLPIFPHRLTTGPITLLGLSTILGCRVHNAPSARGSQVKTVEVLCSPQARRYVEKGTQSWRQLCYRCNDPELPQSSH